MQILKAIHIYTTRENVSFTGLKVTLLAWFDHVLVVAYLHNWQQKINNPGLFPAAMSDSLNLSNVIFLTNLKKYFTLWFNV